MAVLEFDFSKQDVDVLDTFRELDRQGYFDEIKEKYRDPATVYSYRVLSRQQLAGKPIILQAFRHLNDLKRSENDDFPYYYDLDDCREIINFAKVCPDVSTNKPTPLMLWQQTVLCMSQGWRKKKDHQKRYTRVLVSVARTNGKSYLMNILIMYAYLIETDGWYNQDLVYLAPVDRQSKKSWRYIKQTFNSLARLPGFRQLIKHEKMDINADALASSRTENQTMRMTAGSAQLDSFHFLFATVDEYGDPMYTTDVISKITSGQVHTPNHQTFFISTAYENILSAMYGDVQRAIKIMQRDNGRTEDDFLPLIWQQDSMEEVSKPETWVKSNPLLDLPSVHDTLLDGLISERDSKLENGTLNNFINRNLNMWLKTEKNRYLDLEKIEDAKIDEFSLDNRDCYVGFDLSHVSDDTAFGFVFPYRTEAGEKRYHLYQHSFVPLARANNSLQVKQKQDHINYGAAADAGLATIAENDEGLIDEDSVGRWFLDFIVEHNLAIKAFVYDPYQAGPMTDWLDKNLADVPFITLKQGTLSLNQPTMFLRNQFIAKNITLGHDPILEYCLSNAVTYTNEYGTKIDRKALTSKIDAADAIVDAMSEAAFYFSNPMHGVKEDKKNPFNGMNNEQIQDYFRNTFSF